VTHWRVEVDRVTGDASAHDKSPILGKMRVMCSVMCRNVSCVDVCDV